MNQLTRLGDPPLTHEGDTCTLITSRYVLIVNTCAQRLSLVLPLIHSQRNVLYIGPATSRVNHHPVQHPKLT